MSFSIIFLRVSWFTSYQEGGILNPSTSSLELSCVIFHLKPSLRTAAIYCAHIWSKFFIYPSGDKFLVSLLISIQSFVSVCGRSSPHNFEKFSISPLQDYLFRCWFSNDSVITFSEGCFPSSLVAEVGIFFSILLFQWYIFYYFFRRHCDVALFTHHLDSWGSCSFLAYPFNRSVVFSFEFSNLIKFSLLPQLESCLKSFLPIVPFFR